MPLREEDIKRKLGKLGSQLGFKCKNEYRLKMPGVDRYIGYVDHVWFLTLSLQALQEVDAQIEIQLPAVGFEITTKLDKLWNPKEMKGDITNLRILAPALGVLVIPSRDMLEKEAKARGSTWHEKLDDYLEALKRMAAPIRIKILYVDNNLNFTWE